MQLFQCLSLPLKIHKMLYSWSRPACLKQKEKPLPFKSVLSDPVWDKEPAHRWKPEFVLIWWIHYSPAGGCTGKERNYLHQPRRPARHMSAVHVNILEIPGQNYFIFRICDFGRRFGWGHFRGCSWPWLLPELG